MKGKGAFLLSFILVQKNEVKTSISKRKYRRDSENAQVKRKVNAFGIRWGKAYEIITGSKENLNTKNGKGDGGKRREFKNKKALQGKKPSKLGKRSKRRQTVSEAVGEVRDCGGCIGKPGTTPPRRQPSGNAEKRAQKKKKPVKRENQNPEGAGEVCQ